MKLHLFQEDVKQHNEAAWASGARNVCSVIPTGGGKTVLMSSHIQDEPGIVVAMAHRSELVSQMSLTLARNGVRHAVIGSSATRRACVAGHMQEVGANYVDDRARVRVASVQTLVSDNERWFDKTSMWVVDEAHHLLSDNLWGRAVAKFPHARGLGLTATPCRADGKGLGRHADGVMDSLVVGPGMRDLIGWGFLTEYKIACPPNTVDLSNVPVSAGGDYSPAPLREAVHRSPTLTGDVVATYLKFCKGMLGLTFAVDIEAATEYANAYRAAGIPAEVVTGKTPDLLRYQINQRFRNREVLQLVNVDLFGEGYDVPACEVVSMARPSQSLSMVRQQQGRPLRVFNGKPFGYILDHVGNVVRHGLPDRQQFWTLDRRDRKSRNGPTDMIPVRTCLNPECMAPYERIYSSCPHCGHTPIAMPRGGPVEVDGDLELMSAEAMAALRGEIDRINGPVRIPAGLPTAAQMALTRRHSERQQAQGRLREAIARWAGGRSTAPDSENYRRFYFTFGVDVATAQTLGAKEANDLAERIEHVRHDQ